MTGTAQKVMQFTKVEHTIFSLPYLFAGAWLGAGSRFPSATTVLLLVMAGVGARVLGMAMNRILDRHIDAQNPRTKNRELPAGTLSLKAAYLTALTGFLVYEAACIMLGPLIVWLSPIPALVLIGYSLLKRFTPLCHFGIGLTLGLAPLGAYVATTLSTDVTPEILLLSGFAFFWISGFDIIYALLDENFDRQHQVHSIPAALGSKWAQMVAALSHIAAFSALVGLAMLTGHGPLIYLMLTVSAGAFIAAYLPFVPIPVRFFPISAVAGIAGALVPFF